MTSVDRTGREPIPTMLDVARRAGVSPATAGRALGGYGSVSPRTLERVLAAAKDLAYRPNGLARSMITGQTRSLGVVLADIENPFFYRVLRGITTAARAREFDILLANTDEDVTNERHALKTLSERRVEGVILCPADGDQDHAHVRSVIDSGVPVVLLDRSIPDLDVDTVGLDNRRAAAEATQALIDRGHRRIALLTGGDPAHEPILRRPRMQDVERISVTTLGPRAAGFRDALLAASIEPEREYLTAGGFHREDAEKTTQHLMALPTPPTAILASDSILAMGALVALRRLGLRVPDDVSLVGFDDPEWAEVVTPPLTVVRQPENDIGERACDLLLQRIADPHLPPQQHQLRGELIIRASIAAPPRVA